MWQTVHQAMPELFNTSAEYKQPEENQLSKQCWRDKDQEFWVIFY